jgi:hypothetical protein
MKGGPISDSPPVFRVAVFELKACPYPISPGTIYPVKMRAIARN